MEKVDHKTISILKNKYCSGCGWPIIRAECVGSFKNHIDASTLDYWLYCSNKACLYHEGVGINNERKDHIHWISTESPESIKWFVGKRFTDAIGYGFEKFKSDLSSYNGRDNVFRLAEKHLPYDIVEDLRNYWDKDMFIIIFDVKTHVVACGRDKDGEWGILKKNK